MKIECTVEELKQLMKKETPVALTTDVNKLPVHNCNNHVVNKAFLEIN